MIGIMRFIILSCEEAEKLLSRNEPRSYGVGVGGVSAPGSVHGTWSLLLYLSYSTITVSSFS